MRLRVSGTDATGGDYDLHGALLAGSVIGTQLSNQTSWNYLQDCVNTETTVSSMQLFSPFLTDHTAFLNFATRMPDGYTTVNGRKHKLATSYTGFTVTASTGNITGEISVYGYSK